MLQCLFTFIVQHKRFKVSFFLCKITNLLIYSIKFENVGEKMKKSVNDEKFEAGKAQMYQYLDSQYLA